MDTISSSHGDHAEGSYDLEINDWVPLLPGFDMDWDNYLSDPITTVQAQPENPRLDEDDTAIMNMSKTIASNSHGKKQRQMFINDWTYTSSHEEALQALQPSITYPSTDNFWSESGSEQAYMPNSSLFELPGATPSTPATLIPKGSPTLNSVTSIMAGTIYSCPNTDTYTFQCHGASCHGRTFGRWPDFTRHYNGAHSAAPTVYWCHVEGCPRSKAARNRPFPRKDKLNDHAKSMHGLRI